MSAAIKNLQRIILSRIRLLICEGSSVRITGMQKKLNKAVVVQNSVKIQLDYKQTTQTGFPCVTLRSLSLSRFAVTLHSPSLSAERGSLHFHWSKGEIPMLWLWRHSLTQFSVEQDEKSPHATRFWVLAQPSLLSVEPWAQDIVSPCNPPLVLSPPRQGPG